MMTAVRTLLGPAGVGQVLPQTVALSSNNLSDSDNAVAWVFPIPRTGTITDIGFLIATKTGTPPAYNAGLVTVDTSGRPTTTAYGGSAVTAFTPTAAGWKWVTLSTPATANAGDWAAVHVYPSGTPPDGSNFIAVVYDSIHKYLGTGMSYGTSWGNATLGSGAMAVKYDDGSIEGTALASTAVNVAVRSNTSPDEVGCKFTVPAAVTCFGARAQVHTTFGSSATIEIVLYDGSNTVLATGTVGDKDYVDDQGIVSVFWAGVSLAATTTYRLVVKPTTTTNGDVNVPKWTFESAAALAALPGGDTWQYTSRADAGAWTDDNVSVCPMGLWVSDIDFSGGSVTTIFEGGPLSAEFPTSNFPAITPVNGRVVLAFDASTDEACYWSFICPQGGIGTSLTCIVYYAMASATSGAIYWQAALEAVTPGDSLDLDAATSFDTANSGNGTVPGTAGYMQAITITMTNKDSIAAGDLVWLKLNRDADNGSDNATGDAYVYRVELRSA